MSDARERLREPNDAKDLARQRSDQAESSRWARQEAERLRKVFRDQPARGSRPEDNLARLERISERASTRKLPDFDPARELRRENLEIRRNPFGFLDSHAGEGLDAATEREVWLELERRGR